VADPEAQRVIDGLFGRRETPAEPQPPSVEDATGEQLAEAQADQFREALARSRVKPGHVALIVGLHGTEVVDGTESER
jgi:hypothetical protein